VPTSRWVVSRLISVPEEVSNNNLTVKAILPWMALACLLGFFPYIVAWIVVPDDLVFTGALVNPDDAAVYFAAIRQGAAGNWLFTPNFSPESWPPLFGYVAYLALGHLISLFGGGQQFWFHALRFVASIGTLLALVFWVRVALPGQKRQQVTAWLFIVLGGGIGWLMVILFGYGRIQLPDILGPEWSTVTVLLGPPHYILGLGFEVTVLGCAIKINQREGAFKWALLGSVAALGLAMTYPYAAVISGLVIGFQMLHLAVRERDIPWLRWIQAAILIIPMLLILLNYGLWILNNQYYQSTHGTEYYVRGPGLIGVLVGFGILLPFAAAGAWRWIRQRSLWLVPLWAFINLIILFIPLSFAGDLALGFMVPVATLAAYGLEELVLPWLKSTSFFLNFSRLSPTPYDSLRRVFIILAFPSTLMVSLLVTRSTALQFQFPAYLPRSEVAAAQWLADHVDEDKLILTYYPIGNYLPRISTSRVFLGQKFMTPQLDQKLQLVESFWDPTTSNAWREELLREWDVDYIYEGAYEKNIFNFELALPTEAIYQEESVAIYSLHSD
jgi:hypothetical protein